MKNLLLFIFCVLVSGAAFGQGSESFDNATSSGLTGSYNDGNFTGDNGVTWNFVESRDDGSYQITGAGLMLRRSTEPSSLSTTVSGGISNFSCKLLKAFTGSGNRQVELFINGVSQGTSVAFDNTTVQSFDVTGIDIAGNVTIEIRNITSKQVTIDDISWTGFTSTSPSIMLSPISGNTSESGSSATFDVSLGIAPTSNVEINIISGDTDENTITTTVPLIFTPANYNVVQTITTSGVDDLLIDGSQTTTITVSVVDANSADEYDGLSETIDVINDDNEVTPVVITEIMYNTASTDDEWIEIYNYDASGIDISDWIIEYNGSTEFTFPNPTTIAANSFITIALGSNGDGTYNNVNSFTPDFNSLGVANSAVASENNSNTLGNASGTITLKNASGITVDDVNYDDGDASSTDGGGYSYEIINWIMDNSSTSSNWQASPTTGGSPGIAGSSVPVELISFTATANQKSIDLTWATATEENNAFFAVERSVNGVDFEEIAIVEGAGTTYEVQTYNYTDESPANGINYYRLRQVDFDGGFEYHKVIAAVLNGEAIDALVVPTEVNNQFDIVFGETLNTTSQMDIFSVNGQLLKSEMISTNSNRQTIDVANFEAGLYIIRLNVNNTIVTKRFIKL